MFGFIFTGPNCVPAGLKVKFIYVNKNPDEKSPMNTPVSLLYAMTDLLPQLL